MQTSWNPGRGKGEQPGVLIVNFCWVCAVSLSGPYPIAIYSVLNQRPHLGHFWKSVIFVIPIQSLFNSQSCNFQIPSKHNFFYYQILKICDLIPGNPSKNATPSEPIQPWQCDTIQWHNPISLSLGSTPPPPSLPRLQIYSLLKFSLCWWTHILLCSYQLSLAYLTCPKLDDADG